MQGSDRKAAVAHVERGEYPRSLEEELGERIRRLERRLAEEVAIADVQQRLLACVSTEEVATVLLEVAPDLIAAERSRLAIRREDGGWQVWDRTVGGSLLRYDLGPEATFPEEVMTEEREVLTHKWTKKRGPQIEFAARYAFRSYMALPAMAAGRLVGVFEAANFVHPEGIEEYAKVFVDVLVPAATAIEVAQLHGEVRQRAAELARLLRNMEDFTHAVHHDLRTPLTIVLGQAQLAERALKLGQEEMVRRSLDAVKKSARRMNVMIEDVVDVARAGAGTIVLHREEVNLPQFVAELRERIAGVVDVSRIDIAPLTEPLPNVRADPDRLERILTNLLTNALKYSEQEVTVAFERRDGEVVTSVVDRGIGISPEDLSHIFERYYRAQEVRKSEGLGLGLYITKMLVESHGGKIWAASKPGQGTTVSFSLPIA